MSQVVQPGAGVEVRDAVELYLEELGAARQTGGQRVQ